MRQLTMTLGLAMVVMALAGVPAAQAAGGVNRPLDSHESFGGERTPAKSFDDACGVALDPSGRIYVSDYHHDVIDRFADGFFEAQRTKADPLDGPCGLAVDSAGTVYVNDFHEDVRRLAASEFVSGAGATIDSAESTGVAVDPATNRVYVDDRTYVAVYEPSGAPVEEGGGPLRLGAGSLGNAYGVAVSGFGATQGDVYVADAATETVKVFDPAGDLLEEIDGAGTPQKGFSSLVDASLAVDPTDGHLLVVDDTEPGFEHPAAVVDEFTAAGAYRGQLPSPVVDSEPSGLAISGSGETYLTSGNEQGAQVLAFEPAVSGRTLTVTKEGGGGGTVSSEPAGIACGSACVAEYDTGAKVVLQAEANASSTFTGWTGCANVNGDECIVTMGFDRAVSASFAAIPQQTLTVAKVGPGTVTSSPARIDCGAECSAGFNEGAAVTLTAVPTERADLTGLTGCDIRPSPTQCQVTMGNAKGVEAQFTPIPQQQLNVSRTGAGQGLVRGSSPGPEFTPIECGGACAAEYNQGQQITLTAKPSEGSKLASFTGCDAQPSPTQCQVTMGASKSVSADFETVPSFRLAVALHGAGVGVVASSPSGISCGATCSASFPEGEAVVLTATPAAGSSFAGWAGGCSGTGPCKVVLGADTTVIANFNTPTSAPAAPVAPTLSLGGVTAKGSGVTLALRVPAAGDLAATGRYLKPVEVKVHPGEASLELQLSKAGLKAREATKHNRLQITVTVVFKSKAGKVQELTKAITFAKAPKKRGGATLVQKGDLFASFNGAIAPAALPRHALTPIAVDVEGKVKSLGPGDSAALSGIEIAINRHGVLDTQGLPRCPRAKIASATTVGALEACKAALVGEGSFAAHLSFEDQPSFPSRGHLLAFNASEGGKPVILVHVYGTQPIPITRLLVFAIHRTKGTYGTVLSSTLPQGESGRTSVTFVGLTLHRTYAFRGRTHSYLSADCPAPPGFPGAVFPLAHAAMTFTDSSALETTISRNCKVSE